VSDGEEREKRKGERIEACINCPPRGFRNPAWIKKEKEGGGTTQIKE